ncbi:MAG: hypothetical protein ACAI34_16715, partial [Verrucomicrobium sp.]
MNRRNFLNSISGTTVAGLASRLALAQEAPVAAETLAPVRALTQGPRFHWFGYYDKWEFDPTDRYLLSNQVDFEGRPPTENDVLRVGMIDTKEGDKWTELGTTTAWGWQ